jgi:hypothetical protein
MRQLKRMMFGALVGCAVALANTPAVVAQDRSANSHVGSALAQKWLSQVKGLIDSITSSSLDRISAVLPGTCRSSVMRIRKRTAW